MTKSKYSIVFGFYSLFLRYCAVERVGFIADFSWRGKKEKGEDRKRTKVGVVHFVELRIGGCRWFSECRLRAE